MNEHQLEISDAYRTSRRNTSVLCGIGIAWAAAQIEIHNFSIPHIGEATLSTPAIPIIIGLMCIYTLVRNTIEYMMLPIKTRQAKIAKTDYLITIHLARLTIAMLIISFVARSWHSMLYLLVAVASLLIFFFVVSFSLLCVFMPLRMWLRNRSGRPSVAAAAIESTDYSLIITSIAIALLPICIGIGLINPLPLLGEKFEGISTIQFATFSYTALALIISVPLDEELLALVSGEPKIPQIIVRTYTENGETIYSHEANPNHPDYETIQKNHPPFRYKKIK